MVWCHFAGDPQTTFFGPADLGKGGFCGKMRDVQARASELGKLDVARNANRFRGGWHTA